MTGPPAGQLFCIEIPTGIETMLLMDSPFTRDAPRRLSALTSVPREMRTLAGHAEGREWEPSRGGAGEIRPAVPVLGTVAAPGEGPGFSVHPYAAIIEATDPARRTGLTIQRGGAA